MMSTLALSSLEPDSEQSIIVTFMCPIAEMTFNSRVTHAIFGLFEFLPVPKGA